MAQEPSGFTNPSELRELGVPPIELLGIDSNGNHSSPIPMVKLGVFHGTFGTQSDMLAIENGKVGDHVYRSDLRSHFFLSSLPASSVSNWVNVQSRANHIGVQPQSTIEELPERLVSIEEFLEQIAQSQTSGIIGFSTFNDMVASLNHDNGALSTVTNDPVSSKNGYYIKTGLSGEGSWVKSDYDPVQNVSDLLTEVENLTFAAQDAATTAIESADLIPLYVNSPFKSTAYADVEGMELSLRKLIRSVVLFNADPSKKYAPAVVRKNYLGTWRLRIYEYNGTGDETDLANWTAVCKLETSKNPQESGNIGLFQMGSSTSAGISGIALMDWGSIPEEFAYTGAVTMQMNEKIHSLNASSGITSRLNAANPTGVVFAKSAVLSSPSSPQEWFKVLSGIVDIRLTGIKQVGRYVILNIENNNSSVYKLRIFHYTLTGVLTEVASTTNVIAEVPSDKTQVSTHTLSQVNSSGISGKIAIRWANMPAGIDSSNSTLTLSDTVWEDHPGFLKLFEDQDVLASAIAPSIGKKALLLPRFLYSTQGASSGLYFDAISVENEVGGHPSIRTTVNRGRVYDHGWQWSNEEALIGTIAFSVDARVGSTLLPITSPVLRVTSSNTGAGVTRNVLVIGDSTIANSVAINSAHSLLSSQSGLQVVWKGTQGSGSNKHEGWSGKTVGWHYTGVPIEGDLAVSPFVFGGTFDFAQYLSTNSITMAANDWVMIHLGINDVYSLTSDASVNTLADTAIGQINAMITNIKAAVSGIRVGICTTLPPSFRPNAFGVTYVAGKTRSRYIRNRNIWVSRLLTEFDTSSKESSGVYLIPVGEMVDPIYGFPSTETSVHPYNTTLSTFGSDALHPNSFGYRQMGDAILSFLKYYS